MRRADVGRDPRRAAEGGITFLDTADVYPLGGDLTHGRPHRGDRRPLAARPARPVRRRDEVLRADRARAVGRGQQPPPHHGRDRRVAAPAQTDYIDLYQLHFYDPNTPIDETLGALDDLVRVGKVRYVGCSNFLAYQLARALGRSEVRGFARFDSVQPRYNLLFREFERELFPLCLEEGIGVIPYNPIAGGMLSGKHDRSKPPDEGTRFTLGTAGQMYQDRYWHDNVFDTVEQLDEARRRSRGLPLPTLARRVGAREPGDHRADHRRQPARAARRDARRRRHDARRRPRSTA